MLLDIATSTKVAKRDIIGDLIEEIVEVEGWPWPWPGDDGGKKEPAPGGNKGTLEERMDKLAGQVVHFERDLIRAGANPEYLFNPHFAYNPYPTENVSKALPFLDIPSYLSTYSPRSFPVNITVTHPPYLKSVTQLVRDTPDSVLSAYFTTRLAQTYANALGPKVGVRKEARRLEEVLRGIKKGAEEDRQDVCLACVDNIIGFIAGKEYVREAFSPEAKADAEKIIRCE
jgi:endothelin-converting enzyme